MKRTWSLWSTLALLPAVAVLGLARSALAFVYAASLIVTLLYHASVETRWKRLDHALAYGVIASNCWMCMNAKIHGLAGFGIVLVGLALVFYFEARLFPDRYDRSHAMWHALSGVAGACFAIAYR